MTQEMLNLLGTRQASPVSGARSRTGGSHEVPVTAFASFGGKKQHTISVEREAFATATAAADASGERPSLRASRGQFRRRVSRDADR